MAAAALHWPASATRLCALRLGPGADLRTSLEDAFSAAPEQAGFIACCVGSLSRARLRPAARDDALVLERPLEIVSLSGTLSVDGPHLHMAVSDDAGAVTGGHVLEGCRVRTTAELVLAFAEGVRFARAPDPATGYAELRVEPVRR